MSPRRLQAFALFTLSSLAASLAHGSSLPQDEVLALGDIAMTLEIPDWDPTTNPCQWGGLKGDGIRNITCNCSFSNGTICHVTEFIIQKQSLPGTLPPDFVRLPYLEKLDLAWNYLNGSIPPEWGSMAHLTLINLVCNRLSGAIPKEIGNISTLVAVSFEANRLSGDLPLEIGNLSQLQQLYLMSNYFTGELPKTFAQLTALWAIGLGDNNFTGSIPDFVRNWTNLQVLEIRGTGMQGPIPSAIEALENLIMLRISDLNGAEAPFPQLSSQSLREVVFRSCNLVGELPDYLADMPSLKKLDVSFNKLTGKIPSSYQRLTNIQYMFLTENLLSESVPEWITKLPHVDLSYNNFTYMSDCQNGTVNLFASSSKANNSEIISFFRGGSCKQSQHELRINCGGEAWSPVESGQENEMPPESDFDGDDGYEGSSTCFKQPNWAYSSTGRFDDDDNPTNDYRLPKQSIRSSMTYIDLYKTARVSPISLTYYGFCLMNGTYNVSLHFAEILFTNDRAYKTLGRRIFDVYIQGKRVLKDFNIADEAGGAGRQIKSFNASIIGDTLEIRLIWAGKGTSFIPNGEVTGAYGPSISAISVVKVDIKEPVVDGRKLSIVAVVGIVIGVPIVIFLALYIIWSRGCCKRKFANERDLKDLELQTSSFTLRQIKAATNNFDAANKIGEGGFGSVYKGILPDGTIIAVKQLSSKSRQGNREFVNEIGMISALQHPHLVKLYGCCIEGNQLLLVYEYMQNNNLARALFGPEEFQLTLSWSTRYMICLGIAKGLAFLHEESRLKIVHRDIKATNVLLDKDLNPKISDFGLARLDEEDRTHISTRIAGTYGYMAPEYAMHGYLTGKADVYSFGIVVLEIVSGQSNTCHEQRTEECLSLPDWARDLKKRGNLTDLIDRRMGSNFNEDQVMQIIDIALLCTDVSPSVRPAMSSVVRMLEGNEEVPAIVPESYFGREDAKIKALMQLTETSTLGSSTRADASV